jgi:hypothetical protein
VAQCNMRVAIARSRSPRRIKHLRTGAVQDRSRA